MLCILGSGAQARSHAQALKLVRPFSEVHAKLTLSLNSEAGHVLGWKHRGLLYGCMGIWNFSLSFEKYFTCSLPSPVNYHWIQVEKFCISKWPCNVLFILYKDQRKYQIISVINWYFVLPAWQLLFEKVKKYYTILVKYSYSSQKFLLCPYI